MPMFINELQREDLARLLPNLQSLTYDCPFKSFPTAIPSRTHRLSLSRFLSPKSRLIQLKKEKLEYTPGEHEYGLFPAPIHVGE